MPHRKQKPNRLESEQAELEEQVTSAELTLETSEVVGVKFQHRSYCTTILACQQR